VFEEMLPDLSLDRCENGGAEAAADKKSQAYSHECGKKYPEMVQANGAAILQRNFKKPCVSCGYLI
jgi:hypothetical protein